MKYNRSAVLITLILTGEFIFLLPFVVARIFRPTFLKVFEISNFELGSAFSVYGMVAMISYFVGGPIADRFSPRKLMIVSLTITALGGIFMGLIPSLTGLTVLYGFWGISTILLYWAAAVKATREFGGDDNSQGRAFGLVDAGRGLVAAVLASVSVLLFDAFLPVSADVANLGQLKNALSNIILIFSGLIVASGVLVWFAFPEAKIAKDSVDQRISLEGVKNVLKRRSIWLQSLILVCGYVGYKCTDDFSLYASDVFGYDDVNSAHIGTISFWIRPVAALAAGLLGDRFQHSRMVTICFGVIILGSLVIGSGILNEGIGIFIIMTIATTSAGIYGLRGLYFALFQESKIPLIYTGSAVGVVSVIGYTPDVFMGPLMGYVLDSSPGVAGHQHLFLILAGFGLVGLITSWVFTTQKMTN
jgi:MFS family permease